MAGEFEVTRLYAKIVPKLAGNFRLDLQRKINAAVKSSGGAKIQVGVEVNNASIDAAKKKIEQRLTTVKAKIRVEVNAKTIDQALRGKKTITVNANTGPAERAIRQTFQKIEGTSMVFAKGISDNISRSLKDGFQIPPGASSSIERHLKEVEREADRAASKMKRDFDRAFREMQRNARVKVNVNDTELEKLKYANVVAQAAAKGIEIKVDVDDATAETKLIALTRDRKVELKVDVDKSFASQARTLLGSVGGLGESTKSVTNLSGALGELGQGFGRVSSVAGAAGAILQFFGKTASGVFNLVTEAQEGTGGFAAALGKLGSSLAVSGALAIFATVILSVIVGLVAATAAAAGFVVVAVVLGALMSAVALAAGAVSAAIASATSALGAFVAVIGVAAAALIPVFGAFSEFMNTQSEAPKATKAASNAIKDQTSALSNAANAAYAVTRANRQVRNSAENLADAVRNETRARQRLNEAQEDAARNLENLRRLARDAAGEEEDAELRLIRARERLAELDPTAADQTDYREALRDVERAERDLSDTREDNKKKLKDYEDAKKKGIKGNQGVIDANQGLIDAERRVRDAKDAVTDAQHGLTQAIEAQRQANIRNGAAISGTTTATDNSTAAQRKLAKQFGELTVEGQKFFEKVKLVWTWLKKLSAISQTAFLPGLGDALTQMSKIFPLIEFHFGKIGKTMGDVAKQFSTMFTSDAGQNAIENLFISINDTIDSLGGNIVKFMGIILPALGRLSVAAGPLIDTLGSGLVTIGSGLASLFDSLAKSGVMSGMSAVLNTLTTVVSSILIQFGGFMEKISGTLAKISPQMTKGMEQFTQGLFDAMATLINSGLVDSFFRFLGQLGEMLSEMAKNGFFQELGDTLGQALEIIGGALRDMFSDPEVVADFIELFQLMPPLLKQFMNLLPGLLQGFVQFLSASVKLTEYLSPQIIGGIVAAMFIFARVLDSVVVAGKGFYYIIETMGIGLVAIYKFFRDLGIKLQSIGINILAGLLRGIIAGWAIVRAYFMDLWDDLVQEIKEFLGIASPSRLFFQIGSWILEGLLNGLKAAWGSIVSFFKAAVAFIKNIFSPVWSFLRNVIANVWSAIRSIIVTSWNFIRSNVFAPIVNFLKITLSGAFNAFKSVVSTVWSTMKTTLNNGWSFVKNNVFNPLKTFITKTIPDAFKSGVESIKTFFNKIKEYTKTPVSFVVNTIYNNGIRSLWNKIAGKVGLGDLPEIRGFAKGGQLPGNSGMRYKDDRLAQVGRKGLVKLAGGEFIVNAPATKKHKALLEQINGSATGGPKRHIGCEDVPGFSVGGFLGDLWKKGKSAVGKGIEKVGNLARGLLGPGVKIAADALRKALPRVDKTRANFGDLVYGVPHKALDGIQSFIDKDDKKNAPSSGGKDTFAFPGGGSNSNLIAFGRYLQGLGARVSEGPGPFGPVHRVHAPNSRHYSGRAIDVNFAPGESAYEKSKFDDLRASGVYKNYGLRMLWRIPGHFNHAHFDYAKGGYVTGLGGAMADRIKAHLSHGEYVMNAKATAAIGINNLNRANDMATHGSSRRQIKANTSWAGADFDGSMPNVIDNTRNIDVNVIVQEDHQAELVINRVNSLM